MYEFPAIVPPAVGFTPMTSFRKGFLVAWNDWLIHGSPSEADIALEMDGTINVMRQLAMLAEMER